MTAMEESREYNTLIECTRQLETALRGDRGIAHYLHKEGFLKKDDYDDVLNPNSRLPHVNKAGVLMTAIKKKVKLNPDNYHKLLHYFHSSFVKYMDIVAILDEVYETLGKGMSYIRVMVKEHIAGCYICIHGFTE